MAMLVFVYLPTFSQHVLTKANALMRSGDAMHKQLVAYVPPGESGMNATWDFRNIDVLSDSYSIEYVKDSDSCLYAIEPGSMCQYRLCGDTLAQVAYQNPLTRIDYSIPVLELGFPFSYGDTLSGEFWGNGCYSNRNGIKLAGSAFVEADGEGELKITDECLLKNVLRVRTLRTTSFNVERDSVTKDSTGRQIEVVERYCWYAKGYRYPLFETCSIAYYQGANLLKSYKMAFRTLPDSLRILADSVNIELAHHDSCLADAPDIITYEVISDRRSVRIGYDLKNKATVSAMIADPMGVIYRKTSRTDEAGIGYSLSFNFAGLRRGKYILYLNVNGKVYDNKIVVE